MRNLFFTIIAVVLIVALLLIFFSKQTKTKQKDMINKSEPILLEENEIVGKNAKFQTSLGDFTVKLYGDKTPLTVSNFVTLAKKGFFNGLIFHRVIAGFMIQGGDPKGDGTGGPDYKYKDEFSTDLKFDRKGILAMANSGPNTNGSQFFITVAPTPHLNNVHTIFGEVINGYDIVEKISNVKTNSLNKPLENITINKIDIF